MSDLRPINNRSQDLVDRFSKMFQDVFQQDFFPSVRNNFQSIRADITETKEAYIVQADLPGFSKDDIQIDIEHNQLTIRAKRDAKTEVRDDDNRVVQQERHFGEFVRSFYVANIDQDKVEASLNDGVLKIKLPKVKPGDNGSTKRIDIK